jgi:nicotinate-nucleotide--dimethylbenzimidazole phosphoribosyltransferase
VDFDGDGGSARMIDISNADAPIAFTHDERSAVYRAIALRRDVRHFERRDVDPGVLRRILDAAHRAPSVGLSQPWRFVLIDDRERRERIRASFLRCRDAEAVRFPASRREQYTAYKLEGILDAAVNVCVVVDLRDEGEAILGTTVQPESIRASAICAVQNLWLAARVEGLGVGWVSIVEPSVLRHELALPAGVEPLAYLCIGHPLAFRTAPMLEELGWKKRRALDDVIRYETFGGSHETAAVDAARIPATVPTATVPPGLTVSRASIEWSHDRHASLAKPVGSLGILESLSHWWAGACSDRGRTVVAPALLCFAADHGVTEEGVSAYSSATTVMLVANVMAGGSAVNVIAREHRVPIHLFDVGVSGDLSSVPRAPRVRLVDKKIRAGTRNLAVEAAMSASEAHRAIEAGREAAREAIAAGATLLAVGELGIGNTTSAAALTAALAGTTVEDAVGIGTGVAGASLERKQDSVRRALARLSSCRDDPMTVLIEVGGLELAAIAGVILEAPRHRVPVVLDGYPTCAAALVAARIDPRVTGFLVASHESSERGAAFVLAALGLVPLVSLGLRLGEGSGAVLGVSLLRTAVAVQRDMATFATAGIVDRI